MKLKKEDRRILNALQKNGRISNVNLAKTLNLSESPCLRKTRALEDSGVITGYRADVDARKIGYGVLAYIVVNLDQRSETDTTAFFNAVEQEPRIIECVAVTGPNDLILKVVAKDIEDLGQLTMEGILRHPSVKDIASSVVIKQIKAFSGLQIAE
jgi:Lrp/AsnC family leucine-responsive transcriptional regulator